MPPLITADGLGITRGNRDILADITLSVDAGDFLTIVGPNGAGKSTLLKCLLGIIPADVGRVRRAPHLRIGYVPQRVAPRRAVPMPLSRFLTLNQKAPPAAARAAAEQTGIAAHLDTPLSALSGGEMQRALLARALLNDPTLLALDEPAQNLDIGGEMNFYENLEQIYTQRAIAIVMVSHDLHFVMRRSRRVICLYHHICCSGAPHEVGRDPAFAQLFGADMTRLMAVYSHHHDHTHPPQK